MKSKITIFIFSVLVFGLLSSMVFSNGGDQRVIDGKYLINLARSPFTPRVGEETAMLISFVDLETNKLIREDLMVKIRVAKKFGGTNGVKREFLLEQKDILVQGGVLEFPYTFEATGLHEIFIDFVLGSNPQKIYESPDFLMDAQGGEKPQNLNRFIIGFMISTITGIFLGFLFSLWLGASK